MQIKRFGNKILDDSFETELQIGEFSEDLTKKTKNKFVADHNLGLKLTELYREIRENPHIANVLKNLNKMEEEYLKHEQGLSNKC
jgi:hypothetical protein